MKGILTIFILLYSVFFANAMYCPINAEAGPDRTLCEGQTAYLGAFGSNGLDPYTYLWDNGLGAGKDHTVVVGLADVVYTVTVTDNTGCTATDQVTIFAGGNQDPIIFCPSSQTVSANTANCEANLTLDIPIVLDDCAPPTLMASNGVILNYYGMYNGHFYYVTQQNMTPSELGVTTQPEALAAVQNAAQEFGADGYMVTVDDAAENDFIRSMTFHYGNLILGLTDELSESVFGWVGSCCGGNGTGYLNWNGGEPNDAGGEDYVEIQQSNGAWNDVDINLSIREAVIEFETMPQEVSYSCSPGNPFSLGTTTVTCTATDWFGNINQCTYDITVNSAIAISTTPDMALCEGQTAHLGALGLTGTGPYTYTWDNGLGSGKDQTVVVGSTDVTYTVTVSDSGSCSSTAEITITSTTNQNPTISCPGDQTVSSNAPNCEANVTLTDPSATDDCAPPILTASNGVIMEYFGTFNGHYYYVTQQNMTPSELGVTTQPEALAAVQSAAQEFGTDGYMVTVDDAAENTFVQGMTYHYGNLILGITDELAEGVFGWVGSCCGGNGTGYLNWNGGEPNDAGGEDYVEIQQTNGVWNDIDLNLSIREAVIEFETMPEQVTFSCSPGNPFPQGTTTVTCTATDWFGNTDQCTYDITVTTPVVVTAGSDMTLCEGQTAYLGAFASNGATPYTYSWDNGLGAGGNQTVTVGATDINYTVTATDANGCTATNSMTVFSTTNNPPLISCPGDISESNSGDCEVSVALTDPVVTDDCAPPTLTASNGVILNYYGMFNGHYYYVTQQNMTPTELGVSTQPEALSAVQSAAQEFGTDAYMVTVDDAAENSYILGMTYHYGNLILGITDELAEGAFGWVGSCCGGNGTGYLNWNGGEPNDAGGEDYVEIQQSNGGWNDIDLNLSIREAVIEFETMPQEYTVSCSPGNPFPLGTTTITCTATDWDGNAASCTYDVTLDDPPIGFAR